MLLLTADAVFGVAAPPVLTHGKDPAAVLIDGDRIRAVGQLSQVTASAGLSPGESSPGLARIDHPGCVITPGLVNAHTHLQYSCFGQAIGTREFFPWVRAMTALLAVPDASSWLASAHLGALENLRAGVTTAGDIYSRDESVQAMGEGGLGGVAFYELIAPSADEAMDTAAAVERRLERLAHHTAAAGVKLGLAPHAPYTVHPSLYVAARHLADRERLPAATHVAETQDEVDLLADGSGPMAMYVTARRADFVPSGKSPIAYLDDLGFWAGSPTLAVHAVHATADDLALLAERGAAVVVCPSSNESLAAGQADVPGMLAAGVKIAVGSDSLASTERISILAELGELHRRHPQLAPTRLLSMATMGGAAALGHPGCTGTLAEGTPADLAVFALDDGGKRSLAGGDASGALAALFSASPGAVASMRGGEWLVRDGIPVSLHGPEIEAAAAEVTSMLTSEAARLGLQ
jgi:5-methylthioadenosine/S-adenosylhomocysteine deaminase